MDAISMFSILNPCPAPPPHRLDLVPVLPWPHCCTAGMREHMCTLAHLRFLRQHWHRECCRAEHLLCRRSWLGPVPAPGPLPLRALLWAVLGVLLTFRTMLGVVLLAAGLCLLPCAVTRCTPRSPHSYQAGEHGISPAPVRLSVVSWVHWC